MACTWSQLMHNYKLVECTSLACLEKEDLGLVLQDGTPICLELWHNILFYSNGLAVSAIDAATTAMR